MYDNVKADQNELEEFIKDTYFCSEGLLETYKLWPDAWILRPKINQGNNPKGRTLFLPWGCLSKERTHEPSKNTRVQLKNMRTYFLQDKNWVLFQDTSNFEEQVNTMVEGGVFPKDLVVRSLKPNEKRKESEGYSYFPDGKWLIHWWARDPQDITKPGRIALPPSFDGIFVTIKARLIVNDLSQPSDIDLYEIYFVTWW